MKAPLSFKRKSTSSLDALLKAAATGNEKSNVIDKALSTPADRIMRTVVDFEKAETITSTDSRQIERFTILSASVESEIEAARKLRQFGVTPTDRLCHVEPIPAAHFKCKKIYNKLN